MRALSIAIGSYPHTAALKSGEVAPELFELDFKEISPVNRAFAPMARERRFDVSEMAIATVLQAIAFGVEIALLPVVMASRFQEAALFCRADSELSGPGDLKGKRVGVRAYSQTTGLWLRGILKESFGVAPTDIQWTTFEGAHVAAYADPPFVTRAEAGKDLLNMLREGELDAAIVGNDVPDDPRLRLLFPDPESGGRGVFRAPRFRADQSHGRRQTGAGAGAWRRVRALPPVRRLEGARARAGGWPGSRADRSRGGRAVGAARRRNSPMSRVCCRGELRWDEIWRDSPTDWV